MSAAELAALMALLSGHVEAVVLCAARVLPVVFLCPFLGGTHAPQTVRVALVLSLSLGLHVAGGIAPPEPLDTWAMAAGVLRELTFGLAIGLLASLPFDAARMGGRFIDLFRGTSAEAILPGAGSREAVTGDALFHLTVSLAIVSGAAGVLLSALWRTFGIVPLGVAAPREAIAELALQAVGSAFAAGFALGAPIAALSLAIDAVLGLFARAAPQLHLGETGAPVRIMAGGAVLWLGIGLLAHRVLLELDGATAAVTAVAEAAR